MDIHTIEQTYNKLPAYPTGLLFKFSNHFFFTKNLMKTILNNHNGEIIGIFSKLLKFFIL